MGKFRDTFKKIFGENNTAEKDKASDFDKELGEAGIGTKDAYDEEMHETVDEVGLSSEPKQVEALNKYLDNLGALIEMARNGEPSRETP